MIDRDTQALLESLAFGIENLASQVTFLGLNRGKPPSGLPRIERDALGHVTAESKRLVREFSLAPDDLEEQRLKHEQAPLMREVAIAQEALKRLREDLDHVSI